MSVFPGFGGWINHNMQQPSKAESKRSENVESNSEPPLEFKYYDEDEVDKQVQLWLDEDKKHPWSDVPPKVKVTTKKGLSHMHIELTIGRIPESVYLLFANPLKNQYFKEFDGHNFLELKSRKLLMKDGPRRIAEVKKVVSWNFLWFSGSLPIVLISEDNQKDLSGKYKKKKMKFMKVVEGRWKVEPLFIDSERLCKHIKPKSREEYRKCSGGRGRIAGKVTLDQYFEPSFPFNLPPISWIIRGVTIKTIKNLVLLLRQELTIIEQLSSCFAVRVICGLNFQREMGIFPGFSSLRNHNTQQSPKAESKKSGHSKPKVSETYPEDREETKKQLKLWRASDKKSPWHDYPPNVKVKKEKDIWHLHMKFTIGLPPEAVFDMLTSYKNPSYFSMMKKHKNLEHRSIKVISDLGPTEKHVAVEKAGIWRFLFWSGVIPVHITFNESQEDFSAIYGSPKASKMFMETFSGEWHVEPWYVDNIRFCKPRLPKNREEYRQCTGGKGLIGSKVILEQFFKPSSLINFPPFSWYIRRITIKTTKALAEDLQIQAAVIRGV